jgi:hypothetical protein
MSGIEISDVRVSDPSCKIHLSNAFRRIIAEILRNLSSENGYREKQFPEDLSPSRSDIQTFPIMSQLLAIVGKTLSIGIAGEKRIRED